MRATLQFGNTTPHDIDAGYHRVDDNGTEASAVTVTDVGVSSVQAPVPMRVHRPYLFVIREQLSGTLPFMGKVERPPRP
jgi:serine protease inhibitor